jgi:hypothetical protein
LVGVVMTNAVGDKALLRAACKVGQE